jgi:hypothetical protein
MSPKKSPTSEEAIRDRLFEYGFKVIEDPKTPQTTKAVLIRTMLHYATGIPVPGDPYRFAKMNRKEAPARGLLNYEDVKKLFEEMDAE